MTVVLDKKIKKKELHYYPSRKSAKRQLPFLSILSSSLQQGFQRFRIWQNVFISFWQIIICFIRYYSHRF